MTLWMITNVRSTTARSKIDEEIDVLVCPFKKRKVESKILKGYLHLSAKT